MKLLKTFVLFLLLLMPTGIGMAEEATSDSEIVKGLQGKLDDANKKADRLETALIVLTVAYIFVYIMGRRRLMRKIWAKNRSLKEALDKAEEADRTKTAFIRNMSHEIRTPLNAINGFSQLLCNSEYKLSESEKRDMVDRITHNVDSITNIVAELLDMSVGESQHEKAPVDINTLCLNMLEELKKKNDKGLFLMFDSELDGDFTIMSSAKNIERILRRILENALKFTEKGSITMRLEKRDDFLWISVADTGIGIAPEKREEIFENFVQLNEEVNGIGLGLTLSRRLARSLGGDVVLDGAYTGGSRFWVTLPIK